MSNWPQYIFAALLFTQLVVHLVKDGKTSTDPADLTTSVLASVAVFVGQISILGAGGFWNPVIGH